MNKIVQRFYYGWWLLAVAIIFIVVIVLSWLFLDLIIRIIWLSMSVKILISIICGLGAVISILYFIFAPESL